MDSPKNVLDFTIIGAQKAEPTSLYKYVKPHDEMYMPPGKEVPYFCSDEWFSRGWSAYLREFFGNAPLHKLWGKATPDYMADPRVPERMKEELPDVKLIALLRNPVERAYSQYLTAVRKGHEVRDFKTAIHDLLEPSALEESRRQPTPDNSYIIRGEYSCILIEFCRLFSRQQMLFFFSEELKNDPKAVLKSTFRFLGVDADFVPPNLGVLYHKGSARQRLPGLSSLRKVRLLHAFWQKVPARYRQPLMYWFYQFNVVPDKHSLLQLPERKLSVGHYEDDVE